MELSEVAVGNICSIFAEVEPFIIVQLPQMANQDKQNSYEIEAQCVSSKVASHHHLKYMLIIEH